MSEVKKYDFCPECGIGLNNQEKHLRFCQNCEANWDEPDEECFYDDEDDFQPCADCDLPDACADFGCAQKQGLKRVQGDWDCHDDLL